MIRELLAHISSCKISANTD